jgi:P-loop containing dynein motor region D4
MRKSMRKSVLRTSRAPADAEPKVYARIDDLPRLRAVVEDYLEDANSTSTSPMKLVMFLDAVEHVARAARVIRTPLGHSLLLGVGGSGRQSLARLAAHIEEFDLFQIEISKQYGQNEWRDDLRRVLKRAGADGRDVVFLFADTQIVWEVRALALAMLPFTPLQTLTSPALALRAYLINSTPRSLHAPQEPASFARVRSQQAKHTVALQGMLEDINNILNSGEVPNLMRGEDAEEIAAAVRPLLVAEGLVATKAAMAAYFVRRVRAKLHLVLAMSPIGDAFRQRLRMFPALVNCCTIDWFREWPLDALASVACHFYGVRCCASGRCFVLLHVCLTDWCHVVRTAADAAHLACGQRCYGLCRHLATVHAAAMQAAAPRTPRHKDSRAHAPAGPRPRHARVAAPPGRRRRGVRRNSPGRRAHLAPLC